MFVAYAFAWVAQVVLVTPFLVVAAALGPGGLRHLADPTWAAGFVATGPGLLAVALATGLALAATAVGFTLLERQRPAQRLRLVPSPWLTVVGAVLGLVGASEAMTSGLGLLGWEPAGTLLLLEQVIAGMSLPQLALGVVVIGLVAGLGEELFFRGYAQSALAGRLGRWPGILVASFLFGVMHFDRFHSPMAFVMGLILGWVAERTGSLLPAIVAHVANNAIYVLLAHASPEVEAASGSVGALAVGLASLVIGVILVRRYSRPEPSLRGGEGMPVPYEPPAGAP